MTTLFRKATSAVLAGLAALSLLLGAAAPAFAQTPAPPAGDARHAERLERLLERELNWLEGQTNHLAKAGEAVTRTQAFIDKAKAEGKDTSGLEAALAAFQTQLAEAQAAHAQAQALLDAKAGFDADGKVTDPAAARQTVAEAGQALRRAHFTLRQAEIDLRQAVREFRRANRPAPPATPAP
ncbi:MAG: hypothetical protein JNK29_09040 [Anaerolineales bacterium]|nr:hypothetical protein [Anaerolineales bacterium]